VTEPTEDEVLVKAKQLGFGGKGPADPATLPTRPVLAEADEYMGATAGEPSWTFGARGLRNVEKTLYLADTGRLAGAVESLRGHSQDN
jgi:hypothetical protein